jgi:pyruvate kinase
MPSAGFPTSAASSRSATMCAPTISKMADKFDAIPPELRSAMLALPEDADIVELGKRHSKVVATIGPSTASKENLLRLAAGGVNVVRLNMCHGDFAWHEEVISRVREINRSSPFVLGTMVDLGTLDTVRLGEFSRPPVLEKGDVFTLTSRHEAEYAANSSEVSSDAFVNFAADGDVVQIQGEGGDIVEMYVTEVSTTDVICSVTNPGQLRSRGTITIRGKPLSANHAASGEDLNMSIARQVLGCPPDQLEFAVRQRVEYVAISFVESAEQILAVRNLLRSRSANIGVIAKIESADALKNLDAITAAADAVMVARGDLGTSIHYAKVPYWQDVIVKTCLRYGKPSLISTHFLESMVLYPTPTRAEVTDMTEAVKQRADALVLTTETASGRFPFKALQTMDAVLLRTEQKYHEQDPLASLKSIPPLTTDPSWWSAQVGEIAENIAAAAATLANGRDAAAILCFSQKGLGVSLVSRYRPHAPIFAFTATPTVRNKLSMLYGVRPFCIDFEDDPEETIQSAVRILKERDAVADGDLVIIVADVLGGRRLSNTAEMDRVFREVSNGARFITASEVRRALRKLSLKVSDKTEAELSMRDVDLQDMSAEFRASEDVGSAPASIKLNNLRFDLDGFRDFARGAQEIVHTIQMRTIGDE